MELLEVQDKNQRGGRVRASDAEKNSQSERTLLFGTQNPQEQMSGCITCSVLSGSWTPPLEKGRGLSSLTGRRFLLILMLVCGFGRSTVPDEKLPQCFVQERMSDHDFKNGLLRLKASSLFLTSSFFGRLFSTVRHLS